MKTSCEVIRDLLPLYHDEVCSTESRAMVDEHLGECPDCQKALAEMGAPVPATENAEDKAVLEHLAGAVSKKKKHAFWKGLIIAATVCVVLFGTYLGLSQWEVPVSGSSITISDVCELKNGMIAYRCVYEGALPNNFALTHTPDGLFYLTPYRRVFGEGGMGGLSFGADKAWRLIDRSEANSWQEAHGDGVRMKAYYIGTPEDNILVWEEGMALPPASEEVEALWGFPAEYPRNY